MLALTILTGVTLLGIKNPRYSLIAGLAFWFYPVVPILLFKYENIYADLIYTESAIVLTYILAVAYQWVVVDKDKRNISRTFSNYLAPQVLEEVMSDPSKVKLGGKRKDISILFSDIRGFTTISEQNTPEGVVEFLNEYFDTMVDAIIQSEGTVDKFIGDAIMAFWGAPVEKENHAELSVRGALGMIQGLKDLKKKWVLEGKDVPEINIGIGINTGEAIVGNVGSSKIKSYTVIGDAVNLASRLEGLNKQYASMGDPDVNIIISEFTYKHVQDMFEVEYLDEVKVKGKDIAVKIYKVIGTRGDSND
jgi:adenylate cyclase